VFGFVLEKTDEERTALEELAFITGYNHGMGLRKLSDLNLQDPVAIGAIKPR